MEAGRPEEAAARVQGREGGALDLGGGQGGDEKQLDPAWNLEAAFKDSRPE